MDRNSFKNMDGIDALFASEFPVLVYPIVTHGHQLN